MRRRTALATSLLAVGAIALTACSGGGGGGSSAGTGRGDITIWYSNNEQEVEWGKQMVEAWNADHPDEQIKGQEIPAGKSSEEVIGAAITAGNAPCLIYNTAPSAVGQFEKQGGLVDLSKIEDGKATFADQAGYDVADFWATMYKDDYSSKEQFQGDSFAQGYAAMAIVGPWAVSVYKDVNWGSVPVPTKDGADPKDVWTFSDAKNIGLYSACKNQATAWDVLKFSTSEEQDQKLLEITGQMPFRKDLQTTYADYFAANPAYQAFGDQASRTVEVPPGPNTVQMLQAFRDAWSESVIFGKGDTKTALDDAAKKIDTIAQQP